MGTKILNPSVLSRFGRILNVPCERSSIGFKIKLPGFSYNDFDRAGHVNIWKLQRLMETERSGNLSNPAVKDLLMGGMSVVMFSGNTFVDKAIYTRPRLQLPMTIDFKLTAYGTSSFEFKQSLIDDSDGQPLCTTLRKIVVMDLKSRKSTPIPEAWIEKFGEDIRNADPDGPRFAKVPDLKVPEGGVHSSTAVVQLEDCDFIYHTNQGNFSYYALNALGRAVRDGALQGFTKDICNYGVKRLDVLHSGEGFPGDKLNVHVWREDSGADADGDPQVKVAVEREGRIIYHAHFSYFKESILES